MKVLFIQHTSAFGGSSRSLFELMTNLPEGVDKIVLCPKGPFHDFLNDNGIKVKTVKGIPQFDHNITGYYRKLRWVILLRELFLFPFFVFKMIQLKKEKVDIVHVNDITQIFSILLGKLLFKKVILHVRCLQHSTTDLRGRFIKRVVDKCVDKVIVIDETVHRELSLNNMNVIHNGLTLDNIQLKNTTSDKSFTVGIVTNFLIEKGLLEFIDAANICINQWNMNVKFIIFGAPYSNSYSLKQRVLQKIGLKKNVESIVMEKLSRYNLKDKLEIRGFIKNHNKIYNNIDILTFPSHLNAVGRPVFEAAFYKVPSIVAIKDELPDTIIDNETGICINEKDPESLANAIRELYSDRKLLAKLQEGSYILANKYYNSSNNAEEVCSLYQKVLKKDNNV